MKATAYATRCDGWWAIEVPDIPGLYTQARRLDQVEAMVQDAAGLLGFDDVQVDTEAKLAIDDQAIVDTAKQRRAAAASAKAASNTASRAAAAQLRALGLPVRDVATLLGVSPQRISAINVA